MEEWLLPSFNGGKDAAVAVSSTREEKKKCSSIKEDLSRKKVKRRKKEGPISSIRRTHTSCDDREEKGVCLIRQKGERKASSRLLLE